MGDIDDAAKVYEQLLAKQPGNAIAANNLASLIADHRSNDAASLAKAKKLVAKFGSSKQLAFLDTYGWVHYRLGDLDKAAKTLSEVVKKAPKVPVFQYHLGMVYYKQGNKVAAREHLSKALAGGAKAPWAGAARRALKSVG
ncbi:MAG TPA: tetratricopeptide repeat protein, partial [Gammaproteobacteria bacterium]|nr:tetratricopeptide repeat protein [Gammaproteobacteria bacterium]